MSDTSDLRAEEAEPPADAAPVIKLAQRDAALLLAALSIWAAAEALYAATGMTFAVILSTLDGVVVGVVVGLMAHEWGHFAGARWGGGIAPTKPIGSFFPIFALDMQRSDDRAFRAMGVGGNVGHWLAVLILALALPLDTPGRVALLSGAFGFAVSASATELPVIRRAYAGASPAESFKGLTGDTLRRDRWIGAAAGIALFLVL
ncbi:MAG: hypothetical protein JRG96_10340 [Deltaproteobacteria bacterium]|nr:hypothetical protein [Deltaproteobacteria bacterium]MBW2421960.1 hypothetical protein [Deltaproteobacteria bacterium]